MSHISPIKVVGGRGKKAPYETKVVRCPMPLVPKVEQMINDYKELAITGDTEEFKNEPSQAATFSVTSYQEALEEAKKIVKCKKSASESLAKLLQVIYGGEIDKSMLR